VAYMGHSLVGLLPHRTLLSVHAVHWVSWLSNIDETKLDR
jgi:hypothetical protein